MRGEIAEGSVKFIWMNRFLPYTFIAYQVNFNPVWLKPSSLSRSCAGNRVRLKFVEFISSLMFFDLSISSIGSE